MDAMRSFKLALGPSKKNKKQPLANQGEYGDDALQQSHHADKHLAVEVLVSPTLRSPDRRKNFLRTASRRLQELTSSSSSSSSSSFFQRVPSGAGSATNSASSSLQHLSPPPRAQVVPSPPFQDILLSTKGSPHHQHGLEMDIMVQPILSTRATSSTTTSNSSSSSSSTTKETSHANLKAMALIGFSAFIYSLQTLNVKFLGGHFDSWTSTFFRGLIGTLLCLVHALFSKNPRQVIWGNRENRRMLCLRGLLGGLTIASAFYAVNALDLAEASVIIFTAPLWTAVLSKWLGMSGWTRVDTFSAVSCLVGMVLVTQPPFLFHKKGEESEGKGGGGEAVLGVLAALLSAVTAAGVNITISKLKGEEASTITLYAMVGSILVALPGFMYHQVGPKGKHNLWGASGGMLAQLCLTGLLSWGAQMSKTSGLKMCKSLGVLVMRYLDIVFCFIWDVTFLHSALDGASALGASVIVGGCVVSVLKKKG